ncbi:uncharacterized protein LOC141525378 [Cotesia typhae]|uniref:uncharacterized protein LOC141525378 n=1 Tax=Cotesia typhae TaxID=2053667 RepID=UPI003D69E3C5
MIKNLTPAGESNHFQGLYVALECNSLAEFTMLFQRLSFCFVALAFAFTTLFSQPCSPGCECKDGYYLNSTLDCVKPEDCVPRTYHRILSVQNCGENQQFSFCRSPCPLTCGKS